MVRNEKNPRGDSIAERYGSPVTASDIEDLMYREHVPSSVIYKVMQAVRAALSWSRSSGVRPWAGDLEDGLTRQEDRRAAARKAEEDRRAALAETLREEGRARAAAEFDDSLSVNSQAERDALADAVADAWAEAAERGRVSAPGSPLGATQAVADPVPGTITSLQLPEPPAAVPEPLKPAISIGGTARTITPRVGTWLGINRELFEPVEPVPAPPVAHLVHDAPARPAAPPSDVAPPPPPVTTSAPPADAPTARSEALTPGRKRCSKCRETWDIDFFQRDKRASDGKRPECKRCGGKYDAMRRSLRKSMRKAVDVAVSEVQAADEQAARGTLASSTQPQPEEDDVKSQVIARASETQPEPEPVSMDSVFAEFTPAADRPGSVALIPAFSPPPEAEIPEEGAEASERRTCTLCGVMKDASEYYTRSDGRIRYQCAECERQRARQRQRRVARQAQ